MDYNISSVLKQLRKTSGYSANDTIEKLKEYSIEISVKTLYGYESGLSMPNANVFVALCKIYHCDNPMVLFGNTSFDNAELTMLEKYRALDKHGKELVESILNKEVERCLAQYSPTLQRYLPFTHSSDYTYVTYRQDFAEELFKGSSTGRFFDWTDVADISSGSITEEVFNLRAKTKTDIDKKFIALDSFRKPKNIDSVFSAPILNAAHERTDIEPIPEDKRHDNDIMDDENF